MCILDNISKGNVNFELENSVKPILLKSHVITCKLNIVKKTGVLKWTIRKKDTTHGYQNIF